MVTSLLRLVFVGFPGMFCVYSVVQWVRHTTTALRVHHARWRTYYITRCILPLLLRRRDARRRRCGKGALVQAI